MFLCPNFMSIIWGMFQIWLPRMMEMQNGAAMALKYSKMVAKVDKRTWVCIYWAKLGVQLMMKPILICAKLAFSGHYIVKKQVQTLISVVLKSFKPEVLISKVSIKTSSKLYRVHQSLKISLRLIRTLAMKSGKPVLKASNGLALWSIKSSQSTIMKGRGILTKGKPNSL